LLQKHFGYSFSVVGIETFGYNLNQGGDGAIPSEATKLKMSLAQTGSKHSQAKLNEENVLEIIRLYKTGKYTQRELGKMFDVSNGTIGDIFRHKGWIHLTKDYIHTPPKRIVNRKGELSGINKLTEEDAIEIIRLYKHENNTYPQLAFKFGVNNGTIYAIINGINWKHIDRNSI
jgi:DNA invertase Pin-like site-specific DNA recombinase